MACVHRTQFTASETAKAKLKSDLDAKVQEVIRWTAEAKTAKERTEGTPCEPCQLRTRRRPELASPFLVRPSALREQQARNQAECDDAIHQDKVRYDTLVDTAERERQHSAALDGASLGGVAGGSTAQRLPPSQTAHIPDEVSVLQDKHAELQATHVALQADYDALKLQFEQAQEAKIAASGALTKLQEDYEQLASQVCYLPERARYCRQFSPHQCLPDSMIRATPPTTPQPPRYNVLL